MEDEDEDVIEGDFTRPRTRDLELADEEDEEEEQFLSFSGDEERELVCPFDPFFFFSDLTNIQDIDEGDIQALDALHSSNAGERKTLADLIFSKLETGDGRTAIIRASNRCTLFSHLRDGFPLSHRCARGILTISTILLSIIISGAGASRTWTSVGLYVFTTQNHTFRSHSGYRSTW